MFTETRIKDYTQLNQMLKGLIEDETDRIANLSNASSLLNVFLEDINWVGFYLYDEAADELVLGPFPGPARLCKDPERQGCMRPRLQGQ